MSKIEVDTIDTVTGTTTLQVGSTNVSTINLGASGDTINIPSGATFNVNGTVGTMSGQNYPAFSVTKTLQTSGQADATYTLVTYDFELVDTDSAFSSNRFTVPSGKGGNYFVHGGVIAGTSSASSLSNLRLALYKNGSILSGVNFSVGKFESEVELAQQEFSTIVPLSDSDYIEVYVYIDNTTGTNRVTQSFFNGYRIGA